MGLKVVSRIINPTIYPKELNEDRRNTIMNADIAKLTKSLENIFEEQQTVYIGMKFKINSAIFSLSRYQYEQGRRGESDKQVFYFRLEKEEEGEGNEG